MLITLGVSYIGSAPHHAREEGFDLLYLWVITPRSGLQVTAQGGPGDLPTLQVRGLVHSC